MNNSGQPATRVFLGNQNKLVYGETRPVPEVVSIIGLGYSAEAYVDHTKRLGGRHAYCCETWSLNALGNILQSDLVFHMDDVRIQEIRAKANPESNIAKMLAGLKEHPGPIMTSRAHEAYPGFIEFPLMDVLNHFKSGYFNNTTPYAIAYAIYIGVKKICLYGMDYTYPNAHDAERGRACVEYWIGRAAERGIHIEIPQRSTLLDTCADASEQFYGYDTVDLGLTKNAKGIFSINPTIKENLPSAEEIEHRYDHGRHPAESTINGSRLVGVTEAEELDQVEDVQEVETNSEENAAAE